VALGRTRATLAEQRAAALSQAHQEGIRAAVQHEQARIAREVHDIVAHDVSVMVVQAGAARRAFDSRPALVLEALTSIEAVGRDALEGLRRLLGLLRRQTDEQNRSPQPDLDQLPQLLDQVRRADLPVELTVLGCPSPLPATVGLNAYRIIQEALTNSLKHARPTRATVTLDYRGDGLRLEVRDEGCWGPAAPPREVTGGYGLISMEQRAAMLGGELVAGPEEEGGFRVAARLPVYGEVT
jgi:signal transduction histidine kinase